MQDFDLTRIPRWRRGYRCQFEPSQNSHVILYPEGMIKLNASASAIAQRIDQQRSVADIIQELKALYGDITEIEHDVIDYVLVAEQQHWIEWQQ